MSTEAVSLPADLALCHAIIAQQQEELCAAIAAESSSWSIGSTCCCGGSTGRGASGSIRTSWRCSSLRKKQRTQRRRRGCGSRREASRDKQAPAKGHGRRRFPEHIERRRIVLDIPEAEKTCPCCGKPRGQIGEVVTERLGFDPARFYVNQYVQLKYACPCEQSGVVTAEKPIQPIEKGNAEPELVAFTAVSRFDDHSPYYRQEHGQFRRAGIEIPRSTHVRLDAADRRAVPAAVRLDAHLGVAVEALGHRRHARAGVGARPGQDASRRTCGPTAATTTIPSTCSTSR